MKIKIEKQPQLMPKYNPFQTGYGIQEYARYKKKGRNAERMKKELKNYY